MAIDRDKTEHYVDINTNVRLHTIIHTNNTSTTSPAILLLHFWGGSNKTFAETISSFKFHNAIIAPSLRGWGQSTGPEEIAGYGISDYGNDIVYLIKHLQSSHNQLFSNGLVIAGHSMGGKIAQYLLTVPEILPLIKGLVLIAPAPAASFQLPENMKDQQLHAYDSVESAAFVVENVLIGKPGAIPTDTIAAAAKTASSGSLGARQAWPSYGMAENFETDVSRAVRERKNHSILQIQLIVGELDRVETPENVDLRVATPLRDSGAEVSVMKFEGLGHLIPLEAPSVLAGVIRDFVDKI